VALPSVSLYFAPSLSTTNNTKPTLALFLSLSPTGFSLCMKITQPAMIPIRRPLFTKTNTGEKVIGKKKKKKTHNLLLTDINFIILQVLVCGNAKNFVFLRDDLFGGEFSRKKKYAGS